METLIVSCVIIVISIFIIAFCCFLIKIKKRNREKVHTLPEEEMPDKVCIEYDEVQQDTQRDPAIKDNKVSVHGGSTVVGPGADAKVPPI